MTQTETKNSAYARAGVDIDAGNQAVQLMKAAVQSTYGPQVLAGIGSFGGLYAADQLQTLDRPVLVASTDGVGTKVLLAAQAGRYAGVGQDIVNHCINDILVQGARPLFFLDYVASSRLEPPMVAEIVGGMARACREAGCALLGGETAEMPGVYTPGHFDVVGTIVGLVDRANILPRQDICHGDLLVGLTSSGPHTNGYSLLRAVFQDVPLDHVYPELGVPLAEAVLAPHRNYQPVLQAALEAGLIKGLAHITGGGFTENLPRILPEQIGATIELGSWPLPPLFSLIERLGQVDPAEMFRVFNMGIGMIAVIDPGDLSAFQAAVAEPVYAIGELRTGAGVEIA